MKKFVYQVAGWEFVDTVAFGEAWREAKFRATQLHTAIYRLVIQNGQVRQDVFTRGGCFLPVACAQSSRVMVF